MKARVLLMIAIVSVLALGAFYVRGVPTGPDSVSRDSDERRTNFNSTPTQVQAQAGNVTQLTINVTRISRFWQGFYGNISGKITLDDADNNTFYNWDATGMSVTGRIFAANDTVTVWSNVTCLNFSDTDSRNTNLTKLEQTYGITSNDPEGFDETFIDLADITVDTKTLTNCNSTNVYTNSSRDTSRWNETLLTVNLTSTLIFAQQLEDNEWGFDNKSYDFQLLVADRADTGSDGSTTYYMYIELT